MKLSLNNLKKALFLLSVVKVVQVAASSESERKGKLTSSLSVVNYQQPSPSLLTANNINESDNPARLSVKTVNCPSTSANPESTEVTESLVKRNKNPKQKSSISLADEGDPKCPSCLSFAKFASPKMMSRHLSLLKIDKKSLTNDDLKKGEKPPSALLLSASSDDAETPKVKRCVSLGNFSGSKTSKDVSLKKGKRIKGDSKSRKRNDETEEDDESVKRFLQKIASNSYDTTLPPIIYPTYRDYVLVSKHVIGLGKVQRYLNSLYMTNVNRVELLENYMPLPDLIKNVGLDERRFCELVTSHPQFSKRYTKSFGSSPSPDDKPKVKNIFWKNDAPFHPNTRIERNPSLALGCLMCHPEEKLTNRYIIQGMEYTTFFICLENSSHLEFEAYVALRVNGQSNSLEHANLIKLSDSSEILIEGVPDDQNQNENFELTELD